MFFQKIFCRKIKKIGYDRQMYMKRSVPQMGDATAKSHDHSFEVLQKSKIGNFSVVALRAATLKIPDLVFFAIHPKFLIVTFGSLVLLRIFCFENKNRKNLHFPCFAFNLHCITVK